MNIRKVLTALVHEVADEAERNPAFRQRVEQALGELAPRAHVAPTPKTTPKAEEPKRPSNRRAPAVLDPVQLARQGEDVLRSALGRLDIEQLRDVVADYGMDTGKLVIKWRTPDRIIDRIVEVSRQRAHKGSAFRDTATEDTQSRPPTPDAPEPREE
ncbi:hypothetical protein I6F20_29650 [Bradyrhizobium sp. IC3123]|uniref:hypothetical protein n=1 Tax=unclassified Bradyrhizobium TaxID=2631580 RepID=UPI001CD650D7|nr:hypothetical protein [Bradyrhizobium sp. IC3123]MCA1393234.1 hypothetical protein [Bradyrhizobium sp. IC3123]